MGTRVAYVSGGGTGIGRAIAAALAEDGVGVVLFGRREQVLAATASELSAKYPQTTIAWQAADLTDPAQVEAAVCGAVGQVGESIDILVNNAGGPGPNHPAVLAGIATEWRAVFDLNVLTAVLLTNAVLSRLRRPGGRVISIGSIAGLRGPGSYGAAKAALHAWSLGLAADIAADGITVNVIAPGFVPDTEFWESRLTDDLYRTRVAETLVRRAGTPQDVADAVRWLAGAGSGFVTGQIIQVNGGALLGRG